MNGTLTIIEKRGLWIFSIAAFFLRSGYALLDDRLIYGGPFMDDAFYALSVARRLVLGQGISADGVHITNGFQPLNTLLQFFCFAIVHGDRVAGLRLCYVLVGIIEVAFLWVVANIISTIRLRDNPGKYWQSPVLVALALQTFSYQLLVTDANGLETLLASFLLICTISLYYKIDSQQRMRKEPTVRNLVSLGLLSGLFVLARIDGAILVVIFALLQLRFPNGIRNAAIIGFIALLISCPWWIYNVAEFHNIMPMSGQAESMALLKSSKVFYAVNAALTIALFWLPKSVTIFSNSTAKILLSIIILMAFFLLRKKAIVEKLRSRFDLRSLNPLWYFGCTLVVYYLFFFGAPWFLERFWHPIEVGWLIVLSCVLSVLLEYLEAIERKRRSLIYRGSILILFIILAMNARWIRSSYLPIVPAPLAELGFWAAAHTSVTIGALQSGEAGFIADNITNLDGKVNPDALVARMSDSLGAYIRNSHLDYIADMPFMIPIALKDTSRFSYHYTWVDSIQIIQIYKISK